MIEEPEKPSEKPENPEEPEKPTNPTILTEFVEIVFGKASKEEVKDILDDYTKEGFAIVEFERDEKAGETRVIVKFSDSKKTEKFVENINENKNNETSSGALTSPQERCLSPPSFLLSSHYSFPW